MERVVIHISIIPARGGLKRISPNHVTLLWRRPMIGWTIEAIITALDRAERHYGTSSSSVTESTPICSLRGGAERL